MSDNSNKIKQIQTQLYKARYLRMDDSVIRQLETHMNELIDIDDNSKYNIQKEVEDVGCVIETDPDMKFIPFIDNNKKD